MTKYVRTISGSIYEIDEDNKCIRRLHGIANPTPRQGADGEYKTYKEIIIAANKAMVIVWETTSNEDGELICRTTSTSSVEAFGNKLSEVSVVN